MAKDWIKYYELSGNPFSTIPLQTTDHFNCLFVKTDDISKQIDPIIDHFEKSSPFLRVIAAPRGQGKSTILNYIGNSLKDKSKEIIVALIKHQTAIVKGEQDPAYGIGNDTISRIVSELAQTVSIIERNKKDSKFDSLLKKLNLIDFEGSINVKTINTFSYTTHRNRLDKILDYIKQSGLRGLITIDNYDKLDKERAIAFLKSGHAQPLFEDLQSAGISIIISASILWSENIGEGDLSYLGQPQVLNSLNPVEASSMIQKRVQSKSENPDHPPVFQNEAITRITIREEGIARKILETCRFCMTKAADRDYPIITEDFVRDTLRSSEKTGTKYYALIKKDPEARKGLTILSSIARETDPDKFRSMLVALVDIMEDRCPSDQTLADLRENKIFYMSEKKPEPETLKNYLASEIQILLKTILKRYSLNNFVDWLAAGEPAFWSIPTVKDHWVHSTIEEQFNLLVPALTCNDKLVFRNALTSYKNWLNQIEQADFDVIQILSDIWNSVFGVAKCAYNITSIVKDGILEPPEATYEIIEQFLLDQDASIKKKLPDFATLYNYYIYAEKGVPIEANEIEKLRTKTQDLIISLLDHSMIVLPYLRDQGIPLPKYKVKTPQELDQRLTPFLKQDERYFYQVLGDVPVSDFLLIGWFFNNYVYAIFCGTEDYYTEYKLDIYELKSPYYRVPKYIANQQTYNNFPKGHLLKYYNTLEFVSSISKIAKQYPTFLKIFSKKHTIDISITERKKKFLISVDVSKSDYGCRIDPSNIANALSKINTLSRPPKLFISYSTTDREFVERLFSDLKNKGIKVWVDFFEISVGDSIFEKISGALQNNDYLAVVLTPSSIKSNWVMRELGAATMKELEDKSIKVLPLMAKRCSVPPLLRDKLYADFTKSYIKGLNALVEAIK